MIEHVTDNHNIKLPPHFSSEALKNADRLNYTNESFKNRNLKFGITIDNPYSNVRDQALWVHKTPENGYELHVSIIDPSELIKPGDILDKEAAGRVFTQYFAKSNTPMLPKEVSRRLFSLNEKELRPTITVGISLDNKLNIIGEPNLELTKFIPLKNFSFQEIDKKIKDPSDPQHDMFSDWYDLGNKLHNKRKSEGALVIDTKNEKEEQISSMMIEELMVLTNQVIADYFVNHNIPALFNNQKIKPFSPSREDIINEINQTTPDNRDEISKKLNSVLYKSKISTYPKGHYSLNTKQYLNITSPSRDYADLVNIRILSSLLKKQEHPYTIGELKEIGLYINYRKTDKYFPKNEDKVNQSANPQTDMQKDYKKKTSLSKHNFLKNKAYELARNQIKEVEKSDEDIIGKIHNYEFTNILKIAARENSLNDKIKKEILLRIEKNQISDKEIFYILSEPITKTEDWLDIQQSIFTYLKNHPIKISKTMDKFHSLYNWTVPKYNISREDKSFTVVSKLKVNKKVYTSQPITTDNSWNSQQLANLNLITQILEEENFPLKKTEEKIIFENKALTSKI